MISIAALLYKDNKLTLSTQIIKLLNLYSNILKCKQQTKKCYTPVAFP